MFLGVIISGVGVGNVVHYLALSGISFFENILNVRYGYHCLLPQRTPLPGLIRHLSSEEGSLCCRTRHQLISHPRSGGSTCTIQKKAVTKLQDGKTIKKILEIDSHIHMAYSGLTADGRILANKARIECQSYRLNYDDNPPVEYISRFIAETKQKYTQKGGVRPFGISCLLAGFDTSARPHLYYTDPSGSFS